jgi:hypothetical protein
MGFNSAFEGLNPICHLLALLGTHHILHVNRIRVKKIRQASRYNVTFRRVRATTVALEKQ